MIATSKFRNLRRIVWQCLLVTIATIAAGAQADAQQLRGAVRDSATERLIPGVVITLLDSAGVTRARNLTNERGQYTFRLIDGVRAVRVQRIGFRARTVAIPPGTGDVVTLDIVLTPLATLIAPVTVEGSSRCPRRPDRGAAAALLEQARAGLLATVVARDARPSTQLRLLYERVFADRSDSIILQKVAKDSAIARASFESAFKASDFVQRGFVERGGAEWIYHAPDADVLLNDSFGSAYCFQLADADRTRPNNVGLAFRAAQSLRDRIDVEGTLWVDTVARAVREIQFRYRGLPNSIESLAPGGSLTFQELTSGISLIDRWSLRLITSTVDSLLSRGLASQGTLLREKLHVSETGGQLALASWSDGATWRAPLGTLEISAVDANDQPASGLSLKLANTAYSGVTNTAGKLTIEHILPGPYSLVITDERLSPIGVNIETPFSYIATGNATVTTRVRAATAEEYVAGKCGPFELGGGQDSPPLLAGRITGGRIEPNDNWRVYVSREVTPGRWVQVDNYYKLGSDGLFFVCSPQLRRNMTVRIVLRKGNAVNRTIAGVLDAPLTVLSIPLQR